MSATKDPSELYDQVRMQFERCTGDLSRDLSEKKERGVQWIKPFNETCEWFERRVVSVPNGSISTQVLKCYIFA